METTTLNALWNKILGIFPSKTQVITALSSKQDKIDSSNKLSGDLIQDGSTNKVINVKPDWSAASGNDAEILNKPTIPSAPGTLNTNNTSAQSVNSSEALTGIVKLHKVSKTGNYNDLLNRPSIPDTSSMLKTPYFSSTLYTPSYVSIYGSNSTSEYAYKVQNVGTCTFSLQSGSSGYVSYFILYLSTGSSTPNITFTYGNYNDVYYVNTFKSFEANKSYVIKGEWDGFHWYLTQNRIYSSPTDETSTASALWRTSAEYSSVLYLSDKTGQLIVLDTHNGYSGGYYWIRKDYAASSNYMCTMENSEMSSNFPTTYSNFPRLYVTPTISTTVNGTIYEFSVDGVAYQFFNYNGDAAQSTINPEVTGYYSS